MDNIHQALAAAIKITRKHKGMTQEDFSTVSSRTYMSTLERGLKSPTIEKLGEIASAMQVHPLTLLAIAYAQLDQKEVSLLLKAVEAESDKILNDKSGEILGMVNER